MLTVTGVTYRKQQK